MNEKKEKRKQWPYKWGGWWKVKYGEKNMNENEGKRKESNGD